MKKEKNNKKRWIIGYSLMLGTIVVSSISTVVALHMTKNDIKNQKNMDK